MKRIAIALLVFAVIAILPALWFNGRTAPTLLDVEIQIVAELPREDRDAIQIDGKTIERPKAGYEFYCNRKLMGLDRFTITDREVAELGVPVAWRPELTQEPHVLEATLREAFGWKGGLVQSRSGPDWVSSVDLLQDLRVEHEGLASRAEMLALSWLKADGALDSFLLFLIREGEASSASALLVRARLGDQGVLFTGWHAGGNPEVVGGVAHARWQIEPNMSLSGIEPAEGEASGMRINEIEGAKSWWISKFPVGQDLPQ